MRVNLHHMEHQLMMMASGFGGEATTTTTTTIKGRPAHSAQTSGTMCNEHSRCSTRRSSRRNVVRPPSSPPTSNKPWLAWPTISKDEAAMEAAEVEEAEEDEEHEEATRPRRQDSGRLDSIAPTQRSAEQNVGQRQHQPATAPPLSPTG